MKIIDTTIYKLDQFQRKHKFPAFVYAVVKKYGDDEAGILAALLTYYGFLALFPMLLVLSTLTASWAASHPEIQHKIVESTTNYFPVLGEHLSSHVHSLHKNGLALFIGIVLTIYGARGVADAFRRGVQNIWHVPRQQRDGFPKSTIKSILVVIIGGVGFLFASICAGLAASAGKGWGFRALSVAVNLGILYLLYVVLLKISLRRHASMSAIRVGAATAAIGLVLLQGLGGYILTRQLRGLDALYSYFAISLGLLFWIYLQAQVLFIAIEISSVSAKKSWPRSLSGKDPTPADKRASELRNP